MSVAELHPVQALRQEKNLSRQQLADAADVALFTVERIETGLTRNPQRRTLEPLAEALDTTAEDLEVKIADYRKRAAA